MRFMVLVKGDTFVEAGIFPGEEEFAKMGAFNDTLVNKGMLVTADGLKPTSEGTRVQFNGSKTKVVRGPFREPKPVVGFWIINAKSMSEAVAMFRQAPNPTPFSKGEIEIRPFFEPHEVQKIFENQRKGKDKTRAKKTKRKAGQ